MDADIIQNIAIHHATAVPYFTVIKKLYLQYYWYVWFLIKWTIYPELMPMSDKTAPSTTTGDR